MEKAKGRRQKTALAKREVPVERLAWDCRLAGFDFRTTSDLKLADDIIGQRRAVEALELGTEIESAGYNIFVTGPVGTGRTTTVQQLVQRKGRRRGRIDDKCYVNNFRDPDQPRLLRLAAGQGRRFRKDIDEFVDHLAKNIPLVFESDSYQHSRQAIVDRFKEQGSAKVREFERKVAAEGFALVQTAPFLRPELAPIVAKEPVKPDALPALVEEGKLTREQAEHARARHRELTDELAAIFKEIRDFERQAREMLAGLDATVIRPVIDERLNDIAEKYGEPEKGQQPGAGTQAPEGGAGKGPADGGVREYVKEVREAVLARLDLFRQRPAGAEEGKPAAATGDPYVEFRANVLVDNDGAKGVPVITETNPNYKNLFGAIERSWDRTGQVRTDFTHIKAGSVLKADGGFLILHALDVLLEPGVWSALKRTLRNRQLEISTYDPLSYVFGSSALKPEPIALDLKVVMIGDPYVYSVIAQYDEDFRKVFKVRADFDWVMDLSDRTVKEYVQVIRTLTDKEGLRPFDKSGCSRVVEYGVRLAGRRDKLSTRFNIITDLLKEASYWAGRAGAQNVGQEHVQRAIDKRRDRVRLSEEKLQEMIKQGTLFIDVKGRVRGQVNGLAVYDTGEYAFGIPTRITAKTAVGSAGIINIEREAQLSGPTHDKGVYILAGYLRQKFAQERPLVLSASICFEQSYGGVDGDSASSTEVYALLSDLSGLPVRQDLAVTGSVNQKGEVQPIGGVNWKVEGFFEACRQRGLTGRQGVIIPKANEPDLFLRPDVVEAVKAGKFHVYSVATIDEGVELLTGVPAGRANRKGEYPKGTVNYRVSKRLAKLAELYRQHGEEKPKEKENRKQPAKPERKVPRD